MTEEELKAAFNLLARVGWRLPHGLQPGSYAGGVVDLSAPGVYESYRWNPGQWSDYRDVDRDAVPKPTRAYLEVVADVAMVELKQTDVRIDIAAEAERRIMVEFGVTTDLDLRFAVFKEEILTTVRRTRSPSSPTLVERTRLLDRAEYLKVDINDLSKRRPECLRSC